MLTGRTIPLTWLPLIELLIYSPHEYDQGAPTGFSLAREYFHASRLQDSVSKAQHVGKDLQRVVYYLCRRYPHRIRVHWVNPWSLPGLWLSFRFRLKGFPCVIINQRQVLCTDTLEQLEQRVIDILGESPQNES